MLALSRPDVIKDIHAEYFRAGADIVETDSFGANQIVLAEYDLVDRTYEMNLAAARIAVEVAVDFSTAARPRWVSGSMGPGTKLPTLGHTTYDLLRESYAVQAHGLLDGGCDLLQIETCQDLLQTKAAIAGAHLGFKRADRRVPLVVQVTIETTGTMLLGTEIGAALAALEPYDIDVIGINCATGPTEMNEHVRYLSRHSPKLISVLPNAGLPLLKDGAPYYPLTPDEFVSAHRIFVQDYGANLIGGCCGTDTRHIRALAGALWGTRPRRATSSSSPPAPASTAPSPSSRKPPSSWSANG